MKVSTRGRYGLRLMVSLARHYGEGPVPVHTLVREQDISENYIHILMGGLKTAGLVRSTRGPNGGYELNRKPETVTALDVVLVMEGQTVPVDCVAAPGTCQRMEDCSTRSVWCQVADAVNGVLGNLSLADLLQDAPRVNQIPDYCI